MPRFGRSSLLLLLLIALGACATKPATRTGQAVFEHDFTGSAVPWTHTDFDNEEGKFTFALFSDLTGGERDGAGPLS